MVAHTSRKAYWEEVAPTLSNRHREVLRAFITRDEPMTNTELARVISRPINTITPRVKELRELGHLRLKDVRPCRITGRTAKVWELNWSPQQSLL